MCSCLLKHVVVFIMVYVVYCCMLLYVIIFVKSAVRNLTDETRKPRPQLEPRITSLDKCKLS